jgi:Uri superfamily endonuclease
VILAVAVEDEQLRIHVDHVARHTHLDAIASTHDEAAEKARAKSLEIHRKAVQRLGEQLRSLP